MISAASARATRSVSPTLSAQRRLWAWKTSPRTVSVRANPCATDQQVSRRARSARETSAASRRTYRRLRNQSATRRKSRRKIAARGVAGMVRPISARSSLAMASPSSICPARSS